MPGKHFRKVQLPNNNEKISLITESMDSQWPDLKFECVNTTDTEMFESLHFDQINLTKSVHKLTITSCPPSIIQLIKSSVINRIDEKLFRIQNGRFDVFAAKYFP